MVMIIIPYCVGVVTTTTYSKIIIHENAPNPFWENIIWAIYNFALGVIATIVTQQFLER